MADWVGPCSTGRKARRPRASRDVAGRRKGLFPSLELRIRPRQNSRRRHAGAPERLPQGRRSSGARRPRAFYRRTLAFWERPSSESPSLDASLPRFPPKWAGCAPGSKGKGRRAPESLQSGSSEWAGDQEGVGRASAAGLHPSTGPPCRWAAPMVPWISWGGGGHTPLYQRTNIEGDGERLPLDLRLSGVLNYATRIMRKCSPERGTF